MISVLIAYGEISQITAHAGESSEARGLIFDRSSHLYSYFVYAINDGTDEYAHSLRILV